jgi:hypothetical protein
MIVADSTMTAETLASISPVRMMNASARVRISRYESERRIETKFVRVANVPGSSIPNATIRSSRNTSRLNRDIADRAVRLAGPDFPATAGMATLVCLDDMCSSTASMADAA